MFQFGKGMSNFVLLQRISESGCPICERVHEKENAFLWVKMLVKENGITRYEIYFDCRRSNGKKILIGEKVVVDTEKKVVLDRTVKKENIGFRLSDLEYVSKSNKSKFV